MLEPYGVTTSPHPQHVGLRRFRKFRNGSALGFSVCGGSHTLVPPPRNSPAGVTQRADGKDGEQVVEEG